jgi:eukaryotic-like serine/threonine-protein kinase
MLLEAGQVIDGKYRLTRLMGTGGMGAVYEGENVLIRRRVAIKILNADSASNKENIRRFEREAQAAGEIGNEHILEVLDIGALPNGDRYMVMEFLDGETLAARIERLGRLTPKQVAPIALQFLAALASAHAAGIIHRDLKPENIFILRAKAGRADFVKLIDFGISKFSRPFLEGEIRVTRADTVLGTPCYMSPEQARGAQETDERSDIYSCGVILYEAVTGRLPFEAQSFNELMFKIALEDAPSPLLLDPSLEPEFAAMITRALSRDPSARFASAHAFARTVEAWMQKHAMTTESFNVLGSVSSPNLLAPNHEPTAAVVAHAGKNAPTLAFDALGKTGTDGSWARSATMRTARRRAIISAGSLVGLSTLAIAVALFLRSSGPWGAGRAPAGPQAPPSASAPATLGTTSATAALSSSAVALAPSDAPSASAGLALPSATMNTVRSHGPGQKSAPPGHSPAAGSAKPKPAHDSGGFELGY